VNLNTQLVEPGDELQVPLAAGSRYFAAAMTEASFGAVRKVAEEPPQRNLKLITRLNELGVEIRLRKCEDRPQPYRTAHFASSHRQGYVSTTQEAFDKYLGNGFGGVDREECSLSESRCRGVKAAAAVLAHPIRLTFAAGRAMSKVLNFSWPMAQGQSKSSTRATSLKTKRSSHTGAQHGLVQTGGSDYNGTNKPGIHLGTGRDNNLDVPYQVLTNLRSRNSSPVYGELVL